MPLTLALEAIDSGHFRPVNLPGDGLPSAQEGWIAEAERASYLAREKEAFDAIVRAGELSPDLERRALLIRAELAIGRGDAAEGLSLASVAFEDCQAAGDRKLELRARLAIARATVRAGRYDEALKSLPALRRSLESDGSAFWVAIADHLVAYSCVMMGRYPEAEEAAEAAIAGFSSTGAVRWEGLARNVRALLLTEGGDTRRAHMECETAEQIAMTIGVVSDALFARLNYARASFGSGEVAEAIAALRETLQWTSIGECAIPALLCQLQLGYALGLSGDFAEAGRIARDMIKTAGRLGTDEHLMHGRLLLAWARRDTGRLASMIETLVDSNHREVAVLYLADVLADGQPYRAAELVAGPDWWEPQVGNPWRLLAARVRGRLATGPVRMDVEGRLVVDLGAGIPDYCEAMETVRRVLVDGAMRAAEGNKSRAASMLGITRSRLGDILKKMAGKPARPEKIAPVAGRTTGEGRRRVRRGTAGETRDSPAE